MTAKIEFDDGRARTYRKRSEVLAFKSDAGVTHHKPWGEQKIRPNGWIVVPLADDGTPTLDVYGIDEKEFERTYEPSPSLRPNQFWKTETIRAYQPGTPFTVETVLQDGYVEAEIVSSNSHDAWVVRAPSGELYIIENPKFKRIYQEVIQRSGTYSIKSAEQHWDADGNPKRILALDGGGVRGILTLGYLKKIEHILRERHGGSENFRLCHYFDLITGTSTGSIIAAALAKGMTVEEIREIYEELAQTVFERSFYRWGLFRTKYGSKQLRQALQKHFGENTMGSRALQTGLIVVAKRLDTGSIWAMANNPFNRFFTAGNNDHYFPNEDYLLRCVVRASTAAPSYFGPEKIRISQNAEAPHGYFVDGGVSPHNNPALLALQMATVDGFGAKWPVDPDKLLIVSVGTGQAKPGKGPGGISAQHAIRSLLSLMDDNAEAVETILQWMSNSPTARHLDAALDDLSKDLIAGRPLFEYLRYNVQLESNWLSKHLGEIVPEKMVKKLKKMDNPDHMKLLYKLGDKGAKAQIKANHFPAIFDLS